MTKSLNIVNGRFQPRTKRELKNAIFDLDSIHKKYPIGSWDVSLIKDMSNLFSDSQLFNYDISEWDVSNVTNMKEMFYPCIYFNQPLDKWNVSNVTNMEAMFRKCGMFNQPLNNWNVSNVTNMEDMFFDCIIFNQPLNNWNVSKVTNMKTMFYNCTDFNKSLNNWNVSNVTNMENIFRMCSNFNQPLYWTLNNELINIIVHDNIVDSDSDYEGYHVDIIHDAYDNYLGIHNNYTHFNKGIGLLFSGNVEEYKKQVQKYRRRHFKRVTSELTIQSERPNSKSKSKTSKKRDEVILNPDLNKEISDFLGGKKRRKRAITMKKHHKK